MNTTTLAAVTTTTREWKEDSNIAIVGGVLVFAFVLALVAYFINRLVAKRSYAHKQRERHVEVWSAQQAAESSVPTNISVPRNTVYNYDQ